MLIETDAVEAELVEQFPGFQMFLVGAYGDVRIAMFTAQRIRQFIVDLEVIEVLAIGQ